MDRRLIAALTLLCLVSLPAWARQDSLPGSRYTSARAAGMADAFLPLGDDGPSALFYNPAAVGKIRATQGSMSIGFNANGGFVDHMGTNSYKSYSLSSSFPTLQANPNAPQGLGFSLLPSFFGKGFAIGLLTQTEVFASSDAAGNVRYLSSFQLIPAVAFGVRLAGGIVRMGYSLQWVNESVGDISAPSGTDPLGYNQLLPQGSGLSHNFGFALTLPIAYLPSVNAVARNIMGTTYSMASILPMSQNSPGAPATEVMTLDTSFSIQPKVDAGVNMNLVGEYRDATNTSQMAILGHLALGGELIFRDFLSLRGGYGSGYPAAGFGFKVKKGQLAFSWYSVELGQSYHELRDIRYMLQFQVRAF
ncbi:hypothetical protein WDW37_01095 [Bdellovibrionota bacterium FG-1]